MKFIICLLIFFHTAFASIQEVKITHNLDNPPFKFVNEYGIPDGILIDIWKLWSEKTGIKVKFVPAIWEDSLRYIQNGNADIHAGMFHTLQREKDFAFSNALMSVKYYYFFQNSIQPTYDTDELQSYVIGAPKGFTASYVQEHLPKGYVKVYNNNPRLYEDFFNGNIKVIVSPKENLKYFLSVNELENNATFDKNRPLYIKEYLGAVKKGNEALRQVVNAGLNQISAQEIENITTRWFDTFNKKLHNEELVLTLEEKAWLKKHKVIKVGTDNSWRPFDYVDEKNNHLGISSEYIKYIEKKLDLKIEIVSGIWDEVLKKAQKKEVDILACIANTPKRREYLLFTKEYLNIKTVILTQNSTHDIFNINDLAGKKVAIAKGNFVQDMLEQNYPKIQLVLKDSNEDAIKAVALGQADAHIGNIATATYFIEKNMLTNVKIVSEIASSKSRLSIGVRNDWEIFRDILQKTLNTISAQEKEKIYNHWIKFNKSIINYDLVWKVALFFTLIIVIVLFWVRHQRGIILEKEAHRMTLLKLQEELQIALQKAEDATKAKSDFLSNMSHEIRTPMNSILGFTEILSQEISDKIYKEHLNSIKTASKTLLGIINDILDLSKIEAGKLKLNYTAINLEHLIYEMEVIFKDKLKEKSISMLFDLDEAIPEYFLMDELRFRQILLNLISNAIKFTNSGTITVKTEVTFEEATHSTFTLSLSIIDTGIGIEEKDLNKIFDYFEQINNTNHLENSKGSGLGLAICTKIVKLLGGKIGVKSQPSVGSEFFIEIPNLHVSSAKELTQTNSFDASSYHFKRAKVLIVDDIADNRKLISLFFAKTNLELFEASNGQEALDFLEHNQVDLVLLDIKMPILNGYETIDQIKNKYKYTMPIIALTASVLGEDNYKIQEYKFDGYLRKPVSQDELFIEIGKFLEHDILISENQQKDNETVIVLSKMMGENKEEVITKLNHFDTECESIKNRGDFTLVEKFVYDLKEFAIQYENEGLVDYCDILLQNVQSFEISSVKKLLNDFHPIVMRLSRELSDV